nr:hypothetical protein [Rhizobium bangladeshense]
MPGVFFRRTSLLGIVIGPGHDSDIAVDRRPVFIDHEGRKAGGAIGAPAHELRFAPGVARTMDMEIVFVRYRIEKFHVIVAQGDDPLLIQLQNLLHGRCRINAFLARRLGDCHGHTEKKARGHGCGDVIS